MGVVGCAEVVDLRLGQIGGEGGEGVAQILRGLAHDGGAGHHAQNVEPDGSAIAVGIRQQRGGQHAVIVGRGDRIGDRIGGFHQQQIVGLVVVDGRGIAERIFEAARQKEISAAPRSAQPRP